MMECFECGISGDKAVLFDAISDKGIVKVCEKCSFEGDIPIIRKPSIFKLKESERKQTVYERLSHVAGINKEKVLENKELKKQERSLREIIDRSFESQFKEAESYNNLVNNFHWIIMRARRLKKLTQEQLANAIGEPGTAIKMAEKGVLPENYLSLIKKLEDDLGVKLIKRDFVPEKKEKPRELVVDAELLGKPQNIFEEETAKSLTISDLKEMKERRESKILEKSFEEDYVLNEDVTGENEEKPEFVEKKQDKEDSKQDLSKEDIDKILFGRK